MKKKEPHYYQIRVWVFWGMIGILMSLLAAVYYKEELYNIWLRSGGREEISFVGMKSELKEKEECYLCGSGSQSLEKQYRDIDTIGVISLNDWYVLEFQLRDHNKDSTENVISRGLSTAFGNTGEFTYCSKGIPTRGMASIEITLPDDYGLNPQIIQNHLCQECIDEIQTSLRYSKWKNEKKEAVPLCLVDFKTLELYSLQDWHRGCMIRDYWAEIDSDKEKIRIKIFSLPNKE